MRRLDGTSVLIFGGSGRMGSATAQLAAELGARVVLAGLDIGRLRSAAHDVPGGEVAQCDAENPHEVETLLSSIKPDHVAVTVAPRLTAPVGGIPRTTPPAAAQAFGRFWATYNVLHSAPGRVAPTGSVTVLSGSSGRRPMPGVGVWGALHGAIESLAQAAALELSPIRVNVVSPGGIGMGMDRQLTNHRGNPADVGAMIVSLMTNPAVSSTVVDVDGGERLGTFNA